MSTAQSNIHEFKRLIVELQGKIRLEEEVAQVKRRQIPEHAIKAKKLDADILTIEKENHIVKMTTFNEKVERHKKRWNISKNKLIDFLNGLDVQIQPFE